MKLMQRGFQLDSDGFQLESTNVTIIGLNKLFLNQTIIT